MKLRISKCILLVFLVIIFCYKSYSQAPEFTKVPSGIDYTGGPVIVGDIDRDLDYDIVVATHIYLNNSGTFSFYVITFMQLILMILIMIMTWI